MKVLFVIRSLDRGGAERQLAGLAAALHERGHQVAVAVFYGGGALAAPLAERGIAVHELGKRGRWDILAFLRAFRALLRAVAPDILHGYMPVANLVCLAGRGALPRGARVVWGVRSAFMDLGRYDGLARLSYWLELKLARRTDRIIVNSEAGLRRLRRRGVPERLLRMVPNGIDTETFRPRAAAGRALRQVWGVRPEQIVVGLVARLDPMKDHPTFLKAAALVAADDDLRFVCIGGGDAAYAATLRQQADALGLDNRLSWLGEVEDMPAAYAALDIATNCSYGEGFSNVVAEAMACGCPCVVTDVGDSAQIVGDTGEVVRPRDPVALAAGWRRLLRRLRADRAGVSQAARVRAVDRFSMAALAERTVEALTFEETS